MTSPGVPDIYQGNELWQFNLVDPDNRRPVDYEQRRELLKKFPTAGQPQASRREYARTLLANMDNGLVKLYLTQRTLSIRKKEVEIFQHGDYTPLSADGQRGENIVAFARERQGRTVIVAVPRLCATLLGEDFESPCAKTLWGDTKLGLPLKETGCYHHVFTGECIPVDREDGFPFISAAKLFWNFPVALLISEALTLPRGIA